MLDPPWLPDTEPDFKNGVKLDAFPFIALMILPRRVCVKVPVCVADESLLSPPEK